MRKWMLISVCGLLLATALAIPVLVKSDDTGETEGEFTKKSYELLAPKLDGEMSVEQALLQRRSTRTYRDVPLSFAEVSQILWAAQGINERKTGKRTTPSAMALYLLDTYLIAEKVEGVSPGMYRYLPQDHRLEEVLLGNIRADLFDAVGQAPIKNAPAVLVFAGKTEKAKQPNCMYLEAGHAAQNVYLQAVSLKMGTVVMTGFEPDEVREALKIPKEQLPIYVMPIGKS
jgi:SagB-type dehydrogenase family enzyme